VRTYRELFGVAEFRALFAAQCALMAGSAVSGLALGTTTYAATGSPLLTALSLFGGPLVRLCRDQVNTIFDRDAVPGAMQLRRYGIALAAIFLITALDFLNRIFDTTALSFNQWCICAGIAASLVVVEELIKLVLRRRGAPGPAAHQTEAQSLPAVPSVA